MNDQGYWKRALFCKTGRLRFIGHLDLMRIMQRALSRADIQLVYSNGFNPHPHMSFGKPLSLGQSGLREVMEVELTAPMDSADFMNTLNPLLPDGLKLLACADLPHTGKTAMSRITHAEYEIQLPGEYTDRYPEWLRGFLAQESIVIRKPAKLRGRKIMAELDVKPLIVSMELVRPDAFRLLCVCTNEKNLKPGPMMHEFWNFIGHPEGEEETSIARTNLLAEKEGRLLDMMELIEDEAD